MHAVGSFAVAYIQAVARAFGRDSPRPHQTSAKLSGLKRRVIHGKARAYHLYHAISVLLCQMLSSFLAAQREYYTRDDRDNENDKLEHLLNRDGYNIRPCTCKQS